MEQTPSTPQPGHPPPQPNPQPTPVIASAAFPTQPSPLLPPATITSLPNSNPHLGSAFKLSAMPQSLQSATTSQATPTFGSRPWPQQSSYPHFSLPSPPNPASPSPTPPLVSAPPPHSPRDVMDIGVPTEMASTPTPPSAPLSSLIPPSYAQQSQIRQPNQGMEITGTLGTSSVIRSSYQLRPPAPPLTPQASSSSPSPAGQNFQGHSMHRAPSLGSPGSSPSSSQIQPQTQPWLPSGAQGKPPLRTPTRPQVGAQSFHPRSITQQLQHNMFNTSQQQPICSNQQQSLPSPTGQPQDHFSPQFSTSRTQHSLSHQQQVSRTTGSGIQRSNLGLTQSGTSHSGAPNKTVSVDTDESLNRIVSKRSIQEIMNQIDPSEKLDPEVEDILVDIAEDFVESITTFGCSLAKHRKSTTLEAKDIMLHLERNWNMALPGFGGDDIKMFKKPAVSEIHRERLAAVKRSILTTEMMSKTPVGSSGGNPKSHLAKGSAGNIAAPSNPKIREAT